MIMENLKIWTVALITCFVIAAFFRSDFWEVDVKCTLLSFRKEICKEMGTALINFGESLENVSKILDEEDNDNREIRNKNDEG